MVKQISVIILTKNSQKYLKECLFSLKDFSEIIVLDNGSVDNTIKIVQNFSNVKLIKHKFIGFGALRNIAIREATNNWILSIDSDEILSSKLINSIKKIDPKETCCVYGILRDNYYKKKLIRCCGWYPDIVIRLFNKQHTNFNNNYVHESIILKPETKKLILAGTIKHYPFDCISSLINKMQQYSTLHVEQTSKKSSPLKAVTRAIYTFLKNYIFQKGIFYGYEGLVISVSNANGVFYKYMKLYEKQKENQ